MKELRAINSLDGRSHVMNLFGLKLKKKQAKALSQENKLQQKKTIKGQMDYEQLEILRNKIRKANDQLNEQQIKLDMIKKRLAHVQKLNDMEI